jgi:hypothetical protein
MKQQVFNIGIFSICFMLIFSILFFYIIPSFASLNEHSVSFSIYDNDLGNRYNYTLDDLLEKKKFYEYEYTGNNNLDNDIFKKYRNSLQLLVKSNDTLNGIHFKFNQGKNYQRFIDVFDICFIENASYIYYKNDLWIMNKSVYNQKNKHLFNIPYYSIIKE